MGNSMRAYATVLPLVIGFCGAVRAEPLEGLVNASATWGSGWLDLGVVRTFNQGDVVRCLVGGSAKRVLFRLLRRGGDPESPAGLIPVILTLSPARMAQFVVPWRITDVAQLSVHGGRTPFSIDLGIANGPATLVSCSVFTSPPPPEAARSSDLGGGGRYRDGRLLLPERDCGSAGAGVDAQGRRRSGIRLGHRPDQHHRLHQHRFVPRLGGAAGAVGPRTAVLRPGELAWLRSFDLQRRQNPPRRARDPIASTDSRRAERVLLT